MCHFSYFFSSPTSFCIPCFYVSFCHRLCCFLLFALVAKSKRNSNSNNSSPVFVWICTSVSTRWCCSVSSRALTDAFVYLKHICVHILVQCIFLFSNGCLQGDVIGVIEVMDPVGRACFSREDSEFLISISSHLAVEFEGKQHMNKILE